MPGGFGIYRSVRGIAATLDKGTFGRFSPYEQLWREHATLAIGDDGAPTGIEVALTYSRLAYQLRSRWRDHHGARRLRGFILEAEPVRAALGKALLATPARKWATGETSTAPDLDAVHTVATIAKDALDFAGRIANAKMQSSGCELRPNRIIDKFRGDFGSATQSAAPTPPIEQRLIAAIVADPRDHAAANVYADWLEQCGRGDEAVGLRER